MVLGGGGDLRVGLGVAVEAREDAVREEEVAEEGRQQQVLPEQPLEEV